MKQNKKFSLKNKIFISFILCCFGVVIILKNLDTIYWEWLDTLLNPGVTDANAFAPSRAAYLAVTALILAAGAFVFYRLTGKYLRQESERQVREKDLIYAAVAHDLKTPMTSVLGFAKALYDGRIKPEEQQETFDIIYRKSDSMNDMVNTLFEYAKLGTSEYEPVMELVDLCTLARDIIAENYTEFEEHGIEPDIDIPDSGIMIHGGRNELKRAVTNLVVNVYKHNPAGIKAVISVSRENGNAVIRIADSGEPIPGDMDIFEPFVTENSARTTGHGTGLGLAVTKRVIERHGGTVSVERNVSGYTKAFVVRLPSRL